MSALPEIYGPDGPLMQNYARFPVEFVRGAGVHLYDRDGAEYLDMLSGLGVNSLGHCDPDVTAAIAEQAGTLVHTSNLYWTRPGAQLADALVERSFADRAFLCNSGAEAVEAALKLARAHQYGRGSGAREVVVLERAFHGRTFGALSATPQEDKQAPFAPLVHGFRTAPHDDAGALSALVTDQTCAVLIEPVQGEGGVFAIPDDLLIAAREACDAVGALLIFDEVQCGLARTGSLFAYEQTPVIPDVMTLAKALGGGLPIGALLAREECAGALQAGYHGTTFGGNPVTCAAANVAFAKLADPTLLAHVNEIGAVFAAALGEFGAVHGRGLMLGVELAGQVDAKAVVTRLLTEHRILANATGPGTLRFLPPLTISGEHIEQVTAALRAVLPD